MEATSHKEFCKNKIWLLKKKEEKPKNNVLYKVVIKTIGIKMSWKINETC